MNGQTTAVVAVLLMALATLATEGVRWVFAENEDRKESTVAELSVKNGNYGSLNVLDGIDTVGSFEAWKPQTRLGAEIRNALLIQQEAKSNFASDPSPKNKKMLDLADENFKQAFGRYFDMMKDAGV